MLGCILLTVQCLQYQCLLGCGGDLQRRESAVRTTTMYTNVPKLLEHQVSNLQEVCILFCNLTVDQDQYIYTFSIYTETLKNPPLHHRELWGRSYILQWCNTEGKIPKRHKKQRPKAELALSHKTKKTVELT